MGVAWVYEWLARVAAERVVGRALRGLVASYGRHRMLTHPERVLYAPQTTFGCAQHGPCTPDCKELAQICLCASTLPKERSSRSLGRTSFLEKTTRTVFGFSCEPSVGFQRVATPVSTADERVATCGRPPPSFSLLET